MFGHVGVRAKIDRPITLDDGETDEARGSHRESSLCRASVS